MNHTYPALNTDLLLKIIRWAERDERYLAEFVGWGTWEQGLWSFADSIDPQAVRNGLCQTAYCIAGQAVTQAGYRMVVDGDIGTRVWINGAPATGVTAEHCVEQRPTERFDDKGYRIWEDVPGAGPQFIEEVAEQVLGLTNEEAEILFDGENSIDHIKAHANFFCERRGLPPMFPTHTHTFDEDEWEVVELASV